MKELVSKIESVFGRESSDPMHGWCSPEKTRMLANLVVEAKPEVSVEIGVWGGMSLMALALSHCYIEFGHAYGVDPWSAEEALKGAEHPDNIKWWSEAPYELVYRDCMRRLINAEVTHRCTVYRTTSEKAAPLFVDVDLLHVDGNHTENSCVTDIFLWLPKIRKGGYVVFDDIDWSEGETLTTRRAVGMVEERCDKIEMVGNCGVFKKR